MSITFKMHTQRIFEHHESESKPFCINPELLYMEFFYTALCFFSSMLYALNWHNLILCSILFYVTIHNEGVYIPFPSFILKLSNLDIKFYLLALTTHKCLLPTKDESGSLKVRLHFTSVPPS
jgi:hypothetical protein